MKKIFYSLLALAAIASCAKTEAVYMEDNLEIKIKPTTALATKANHLAAIDGTEYPVAENFDVYGYWANLPAGSSFTNEDAEVTTYLGEGGAVEFTNKGNYWGGKTTYFWPKNGSLRFAAYSPSSVDMDHDLDSDTYTVKNYYQPSATAETWDLLIAPTSQSYTAMTAAENVSVVFEHALSWITVKVVAKDADAAKAFDIKKVTINDVVTTADLTAVMSGAEKAMTWGLSQTTAPVEIFNGSQGVTLDPTVIETIANGTLVIPQPTTTITVDYTQKALEGTPQLDNQSETVALTLDADNNPWKPGKHYIYTLVFGLDEILINPDVVDWDDVIVNEVEVGKTNIYSAEQLAEALTADEENIEVVLVNDIDLPISSLGQITGGSGEYKLGGENTKNITIDLNGKTLNVTTTYWSNLGAKNDDALITIKNGTMTSSQPTGTWNSYDLTFSNCNYVIEDVVFEKAIALCNMNRAATLKNVTINETHDYYAMWISAEGQNVTIDNLTINSAGRGIKIDEQYVNEALAKVTLNVSNSEFDTVKKAAIVAKTAAGADITLANNDITKVDEDSAFAVWVDEDAADYASLVVVKGGLCRVEGTSVLPADTEESLKNLLTTPKEEINVVLYNDLTYDVAAWENDAMGTDVTKVVTIDLNGKTLTFNHTNSDWNNIATKGAKLVIKNGHITNTGHNNGPWNRHDLNFACPVELVNVTSDKAFAFKSDATLTDVTIADANTSDTYAIWVQPKGQTIILDGCTIDMLECTDGRGLKIDNQYLSAADEAKVTLKISDTVFKTEEKAAILVKTTVGADITLNNVDITGVAADHYNHVWVDSASAAYGDLVTVTGGNKKQE